MKAVSSTSYGLEAQKARRVAIEEGLLQAGLSKLEDMKRSTIACPDCGRGTCWKGAKVTESPKGKPSVSVRPEAPRPMTQQEKERDREHRRRWNEDPEYRKYCRRHRASNVAAMLAGIGVLGYQRW